MSLHGSLPAKPQSEKPTSSNSTTRTFRRRPVKVIATTEAGTLPGVPGSGDVEDKVIRTITELGRRARGERLHGLAVLLDVEQRFADDVGTATSHADVPVDSRAGQIAARATAPLRSEEHTSELQSLMRISYAVFCVKKKNQRISHRSNTSHEY